MSRPATPNANPVSVPLQAGMQIVNMRPTSNMPLTTRAPRMLVNQISGVRPGQSSVTLQALQNAPGSHLVLKTDAGLQFLRVNPASGQIGSNGAASGTTMVVQTTGGYRFQQTQSTNAIVSQANSNSATSHTSNTGTVVVPASMVAVTSQSLVNQSVAGTLQPAASPVGTVRPRIVLKTQNSSGQTISAESAKSKCKNFLSTLLRLAGDQKAKVAQSVQSLIQGLIDGKVEPEKFTEELQKDLNSSPQPCLVPFLKKTLPYLRTSLAKGEIKIDGIKPPPLSSVQPVTGMTTVIPSMMGVVRNAGQNQVRLLNPSTSTTVVQKSLTPGAVPPNARLLSVQQVRMTNKVIPSVKTPSSHTNSIGMSSLNGNMKSINKLPAKDDKKSKDKNNLLSFNTSNVADDDINDVAAMGGVNLGEESQKILESTGYVGTQIRSCRDDTFLNPTALFNKVKQISAEYGLEEPTKEVIALISHATQHRLKEIIEKLGGIAEHRLDIIKNEERYEVSRDTKGQLKFLEELDKLEKKKKDEQEREILLKAAKSRSKTEDPEQARLKAKAKEMQRVEMEESLKNDANLTALSALQGSRKRIRLDDEGEGTFSGTFTQRKMPMRRRVTRVSVRDMQFLMEEDKSLSKSNILFKCYLK